MMPLAFAMGQVRIVSVNCGRGCSEKLSSLGLVPGTSVTVLSNAGGPVVLDVKGSRLAIGRGMALRILVEAI